MCYHLRVAFWGSSCCWVISAPTCNSSHIFLEESLYYLVVSGSSLWSIIGSLPRVTRHLSMYPQEEFPITHQQSNTINCFFFVCLFCLNTMRLAHLAEVASLFIFLPGGVNVPHLVSSFFVNGRLGQFQILANRNNTVIHILPSCFLDMSTNLSWIPAWAFCVTRDTSINYSQESIQPFSKVILFSSSHTQSSLGISPVWIFWWLRNHS